MSRLYYRPIVQTDPVRPAGSVPLAGGWCWFDRVEVLSRAGSQGLIAATDLPDDIRERLTGARAPLAGVAFDRPRLMGILNVTPDSFSDGGRFAESDAALTQAHRLALTSDILDIGGESTRPGAAEVAVGEEIRRTAPLIAELRAGGVALPISIDTRKAEVARAAVGAGASLINDVAAMTHDPALGLAAAEMGLPLCLMHAQGTPATMQTDPQYGDVLLDVYDFLDERLSAAGVLGIPRARLIADPGIGFGKTLAHNLTLLRGLALFHGLGVPILLGASRKRFIGTIAEEPVAERRDPGTIAVTLAAVAQGVQIHRVHDTEGTRQALCLWQAVQGGVTV